MPNDNDGPAKPKYKTLSMADKKAIYYMVLSMSDDGVPARGAYAVVASHFSVTAVTVARQFKNIHATMQNSNNDDANNENEAPNNNNKIADDKFETKLHLCRKGKYVYDREELKQRVLAIPFSKRRKERHLAAQLGMARSTVHYLLRGQKIFKRISSAVKPKLTEANKVRRLEHAMSKIDLNTTTTSARLGPAVPKHMPLFDEAHVDEKWFFLCRDGESYILMGDEEEPPERYVKHKSHITKVMFLCTMARLRHMPNGTWWDGKLGIWPIGNCTEAIQSSTNRPAGTALFEPKTIDRVTHRELMLNEVVPAIQSLFPTCELSQYDTIYIQQDGAPSHIPTKNEDDMWFEEMKSLGLKERIKLVTQPPNSRDLNVNDLGFFNALQSTYHSTCPWNAMELIEMVTPAYKDYPVNKINRIWLTSISRMHERDYQDQMAQCISNATHGQRETRTCKQTSIGTGSL